VRRRWIARSGGLSRVALRVIGFSSFGGGFCVGFGSFLSGVFGFSGVMDLTFVHRQEAGLMVMKLEKFIRLFKVILSLAWFLRRVMRLSEIKMVCLSFASWVSLA
jgi:hypothetical protein